MKLYKIILIKPVFLLFLISISLGMFCKRTNQQDFFHKLIPRDTIDVVNLSNTKKLNKLSSASNIVNEYQNNFIVYDGKNLVNDNNFSKNFTLYKKAYIKKLATTPAFDRQYIFLFKKDGCIQCYDRYTDQQKWSFKFCKIVKGNFVSISVQDGYLTAIYNNMLFVLDKETGREIIYKSLTSTIVSSAVIKSNILCLQTHASLHFIDLNTKREIRKQYGIYGDIMTNQIVSPIFYKNGILSTHLYNKIIYLPMNDNINEVKFLPNFVSDVESVLYKSYLNKSCSVTSQPIICGDELFVSFGYAKLIKYDLNEYKKLWSVNIPGLTHVTKYDNFIFCIGHANQLAIVDACSGKILFVKDLSYLKPNAFLLPIIINDCVCLISKTSKEIILISLQKDRDTRIISIASQLSRDEILSVIPIDGDMVLFTAKKAIKLS